MRRLGQLLWRWAPLCLYVALVLGLSMRPSAGNLLPYGLDKIVHVIEYGILGLLLQRATGCTGQGAFVVIVVAGLMIGLGDEWIQSSSPGRESSVWDALADLIGVGIGAVAGRRFWSQRYVRRLA